ncbi:hypothetical protein GLYMA_01G087000v4 [Glycine max]|nr:hypothetical protein GLYMA_01G087000v4 [Glycine max]KAH1162271.1 hypothetical protein GYH30_000955 [Glycine max]
MPVLIPHPLAMVDFRKVCAHLLMSACAMEYLILGSYRFYEPILLFLTLSLACILLVTDDNDLFLQNGDIINIDVTVYLDGYHGDTSKTFFCGEVGDELKNLVKVTEECLEKGIAACKDGALFRKIGKRISEHAEKYGYGVVERFVGHGVGTVFHSEPIIMHNQPILSMGSIDSITWPDNWTTITADGSPAAQFEHTILITKTGAEILTKC